MNPTQDPHQAMKDESHLRLLVIFHYLLGALELLGGIFLIIMTVIMVKMFQTMPTAASGTPSTPVVAPSSAPASLPAAPTTTYSPPPEEFMDTMSYFILATYGGMALLVIILAVFTLLTAFGISKKKWETLSLITAGCQCLMFPFGTALGIFTFIILLRPSIAAQYRANKTLP